MESQIYMKYIEAKDTKNLKLIEKLYNSYPYETRIKFEYAKQLLRNNRINKARELFKELLDTASKNYALLELGKLEKIQKNEVLARFYFNQLLNTKLKYHAMLELGKLERALGNNNEARKFFCELSVDNNRFALLELGKLEKEEGNLDIACKYFKQALKTSSWDSATLELGKIEAKNGNFEAAKNYFNLILKTKNKDAAMLELGKIEKQFGNYDKARNYYKTVLTTSNVNHGLSELGKLEYEIGNYGLAQNYFEQLLKVGDKSYAISLLVLLKIEQEDYISAMKYIKYAIENNIFVRHKLLLFISKKLNIFFDVNYEHVKVSPSMDLCMDYDEYVVFDKINSKNSELSNIFKHIENFLIDRYKLKKIVFNDIYVIPYKKVETDENSFLVVVTVPNSKEIITMYTTNNPKNVNNLIESEENEKSYRL